MTVMHGGARGADSIAAQLAVDLGMVVVAYPADWDRYGEKAGRIRNQRMLQEGKPDLVLAFYDGRKTPGTTHMVALSRNAGIPTREYGLYKIEEDGNG